VSNGAEKNFNESAGNICINPASPDSNSKIDIVRYDLEKLKDDVRDIAILKSELWSYQRKSSQKIGALQKIIENPGFGFSTAFNLKIKRIELRDTTTVISFHTTDPGGTYIVIPKQTYIKPENGKKLFVLASEGIQLNKSFSMPVSRETDYKLY
jgi:hypothetical protein